MNIYLVGGAIRDELLGITPHEFDYVVTGETPETMKAAGFTQVGADFPVFLHPKTKEEYALARTERKKGHGYKGFVFATKDISLEEDLYRRDLTINAIARDQQGRLIDPYNGQKDLQQKILRHVGPAFTEDPVRLLRVARFLARFIKQGFSIAPETLQLMKELVASGEIDHLVPERISAELIKALNTKTPSAFFNSLNQCGALSILFPEISALFGTPQSRFNHPEIDAGIHTMLALDYAASNNYPLKTRFAIICHDLGKAQTPKELLPSHPNHEQPSAELTRALCKRLKMSKSYQSIAEKTAQFHTDLHKIFKLDAKEILTLLKHFSAPKNIDQFDLFLKACISDCRGRLWFENEKYPQADYARALYQSLNTINSQDVIKKGMTGEQIKQAIYTAQLAQIQSVMDTFPFPKS